MRMSNDVLGRIQIPYNSNVAGKVVTLIRRQQSPNNHLTNIRCAIM